MPEENSLDLQRALDLLEDPMLDKPLARGQYFKVLINSLESGEDISISILNRLLKICADALEEDKKSSLHVLRILNLINKKVKAEDALPHLLPSALAVLNIIKTAALLSKMETMQTLCFETLLSYPKETLIEIGSLHTTEVTEVLNLYCHQQIPLEIRILPCRIVSKLLKLLPPEKRRKFVEDNLSVWFSKVIPTVVVCIKNESINSKPLKTLEHLTDELTQIDYEHNSQWHELLESIYNPQKYPAIMKELLVNGSKNWHRLWIVCIRLLKDQITKTTYSSASPINAMLPVVELAFKMDVENRCKAFQCWEVLIDNFSTETNETYVVKRLKLLIIPLKSNNAKVEETALAKLKTWWHLIHRFQTRIDKFVDIVVISFLHFCFGKHTVSSSKIGFVPGLLTSNTKRQSVETFVELAGHLCCTGCINNIPKLNGRIISKGILVDHWNHWVYSLKVAIKIAKEDVGLSNDHIVCLWKSFVTIIAELPADSARNNLFNELLTVLEEFLQSSNNKFSDIVLTLIGSLFDVDKIKVLFKNNDEQGPMHKLILLLLCSDLNTFYKRTTTNEIVGKLKPFTNYVLESKSLVPWILKNTANKNNVSFLLTALAESVYELGYDEIDDLTELMIWPLKSTHFFPDIEYSTKVWVKLINFLYPKLKPESKDTLRTALNQDIIQSNTNLKLQLCVAVLNREVINNSVSECSQNVELLMEITNRIEDHKYFKDSLTAIVNAIVPILIKNKDVAESTLLRNTMVIVRNILKFANLILEENDGENEKSYEYLLKHLDDIFQTKSYSPVTTIVIEDLLKCSSVLIKYPLLRRYVVNTMKAYVKSVTSNNIPIVEKVKALIKQLSFQSNDCDKNGSSSDVKFAAPDTKAKKSKKKESTIVNKVVENGEEFVVVKSNWKFNPRKLTENQKEKLQRKREDIPALYQDLSQSQDDFKLNTWKTDSQDSSTNSKSATNSKSGTSDVSEILKNIPSSDVVPKIIENIFSDKKDEGNKFKDDSTSKLKQTNVKDPKSPRMALKDRVFRNVRNLIEKSNVHKDSKDLSVSLIKIDNNVPKTPVSKIKDNINLVNSAPSNINADRPSRLKRKPKKFDDTEIFALKKSRRSSSISDSQVEPRENEIVIESKEDTNKCTILSTICQPTENISNPSEVDSVSDDVIDRNDDEPSKMSNEEKNVANNETLNIDADNIEPMQALKTNSYDNDIPSECSPPITCKLPGDLPSNDELSDFPANVMPEKSNMDSNSKDKGKVTVSSDDPLKSNKNVVTPRITRKQESLSQRSGKKDSLKKSRIEKELAIDTVEGHPFLKIQTEKRITRKNLNNSLNNSRRKSLTVKLSNKSKGETKTPNKSQINGLKKKEKDNAVSTENVSITIDDSQERSPVSLDSQPYSEDIIESSQDTTISVKTSKQHGKKRSLVSTDKTTLPEKECNETFTELYLNDKTTDLNGKDDSELPQNKTATSDKTDLELTENMDTQPVDSNVIEEKENSSDVIMIEDDDDPILVGSETQEIAEADTQSIDPSIFLPASSINVENKPENASIAMISTTDEKTASSPFKDEEQRKKDFLDNTLEISPIKTMSPVRNKKSPSPETSSDYVVIKLSSPVQSNGEPFEKCDSPEIFTEDKVSPDKRDLSPPRDDNNVNNTSPSSSLSLKKNRPQVRSGGRAAQMLGLCVPDRLQTIMNSERSEPEEPKRNSPSTTPARRNLRILYNSVGGDNSENSEENEDSENFLKFKKTMPMLDCSPSGPILKRKLAEISDDATVSPASKRKRVSFHDPPVSTTISVQKYIEPCGIRSPQNSAVKRQERQNLRSQAVVVKSPKRLDNVFKLVTALTKTVESFTEADQTTMDITQSMSLDETPAVEMVKNSDLNNVDSIYPELVDCNDPIDNIAAELSSASMKTMFLKELEGKINTIGDLAKLTELEVNRLCIKAPKVQVAKKTLSDYNANKKSVVENESVDSTFEASGEKPMESKKIHRDVEIQTHVATLNDSCMQTADPLSCAVFVQTDTANVVHTSVQTKESGVKSTSEIITACLAERPEFVDKLCECLEESSKRHIADQLPFDVMREVFFKHVTRGNSIEILSLILENNSKANSSQEVVSSDFKFLQDYMLRRFNNKDLILFCSHLLGKIHENET